MNYCPNDRKILLVDLIRMLKAEQLQYQNLILPEEEEDLFAMYRGLVNLRPPLPASPRYLELEDTLLQSLIAEKKVVMGDTMPGPIALWQGDITTLQVDAVVNAANNRMLGCFVPDHGCIDNAIHTFAGVRLRLKCHELMEGQGCPEPIGTAKVTEAYNLPSDYILHTVGPVVHDTPTKQDCDLLASCYRSCLELAWQKRLRSVAFCCISTGEYHFPNRLAAEIAVAAVKEFQQNHEIKVIFNVLKDVDLDIYSKIMNL